MKNKKDCAKRPFFSGEKRTLTSDISLQRKGSFSKLPRLLFFNMVGIRGIEPPISTLNVPCITTNMLNPLVRSIMDLNHLLTPSPLRKLLVAP